MEEFLFSSTDVSERSYSTSIDKKFSAGVEAANTSNPPREQIEALLSDIAEEKGIPPVILQSIASVESNLRQFDNDGLPLPSFDLKSWGIMQVTPESYPGGDLEKLKTNMAYNIRAGADILLDKWSYALAQVPVRPKIGDANPRTLENWYFAIWSYNGWTSISNPRVNSNPYQEKVIGRSETEFNRVINKLPAQSLPASGLPNPTDRFDTPQPIHSIIINDYQKDDIVVDMTISSGLTLRDKENGWERLKSLSPGLAMMVIEGPELYNGYNRFKVRAIYLEDNYNISDIGWVTENWTKKMRKTDINNDNVTDLFDYVNIAKNVNREIDEHNESLNILDMNYDKKIDNDDLLLASYSAMTN